MVLTPMARRYNILHPPVLSFFSRAFYDDVARRWKGLAFLYLFLLLTVTWVVPGVQFYGLFKQFIESDGAAYIEQVPAITIRDGQVSIDQPVPYRITEPETGRTRAIIDTSGQITSLDDLPEAFALLTCDRLITRNNGSQTRTFDLADIASFDLDRDKINAFIERFTIPIVTGFYAMCLLGSFVYRIVQALIYAAIAVGFASMLAKPLRYDGAVRLAVMAVTPVIVLDTVFGLVGVTAALGCWWWSACLVIALAYLLFAARSITDEEIEPPAKTDVFPSWP